MKKILIITLGQGTNYGGMLQAYALQKTLKGFGLDVESTYTQGIPWRLIIKAMPGVQWFAAKIRRKAQVDRNITTQYTDKFVNNNLQLIDYHDAVRESRRGGYDAYVVGSDQVWRKPYTYVPHNLFSFVRGDATKISYAASFGRNDLDEYGDKLIAKTKKLAQRFDAISVREDSGVEVVRTYWAIDAEQHVDPTLLVDADEYIELVKSDDLPLHASGGELFAYVLDTAPGKQGVVDVVARAMRLKSFTVIDGDKNSDKPMPPVTQWIKSFMDAEYVVTDSFHGTVLSIIFNKPFIAIGNRSRGLTRFVSLLKVFGLEDRLVSDISEVTDELIKSKIDWEKVNTIKKREQKRSHKYLKEYLG